MYGSTASCSSRCRSPRTSSFAAAAAAVWFAGTRLARHTDAIAQTTGIGREFLGMVLLGGVTSPATVQGAPTLSINDALGSAATDAVIRALHVTCAGFDHARPIRGT
jgi:cation:H+ antiporter